jgi:hypothetical protein
MNVECYRLSKWAQRVLNDGYAGSIAVVSLCHAHGKMRCGLMQAPSRDLHQPFFIRGRFTTAVSPMPQAIRAAAQPRLKISITARLQRKPGKWLLFPPLLLCYTAAL